MIDNTNDLSKFGYKELKEAANLLTSYCDEPSILCDGVKVEFNPNSGCVFLVDEDYNVAMMNDNNLEKWYNCPYCGYEGFLEDMKEHGNIESLNSECIQYLQDIGSIEKNNEDED